MYKSILLSVIVSVFSFNIYAQSANIDTFSQSKDSVLLHQVRLRYTFKQLYIPAGFIIAGAALEPVKGLKNSQLEFHNNHLTNFHTPVDNYLQFAPIAVAYGLDFMGVPAKTDFENRSAILFKSEVLLFVTSNILKRAVNEERPNGTNYSFPSGHTTEAFAAAAFLSEEYSYRFKWMPYLAYGMASATAVLRLANNEHYFCDVLAGAGIGILSTKIAYWTHQYKWGKHKRPVLEPYQ